MKLRWLTTSLIATPITTLIALAPVISCATANSQTTQPLNQIALDRAARALKASFSRFVTTDAKSAQAAIIGQNYLLKPKQLFGFKATLEPITPEDESHDGDNQKGTKRVKLTVTRSDYQPLSTELILGGFLSDPQLAAETANNNELLLTKHLMWIPGHPMRIKTNTTKNVRQALTILQTTNTTNDLDKLAQLIPLAGNDQPLDPSIPNDIYSPSLLVKKTLDPNINLNIINAEIVTIDNYVTDQIKVSFQLAKNDQKSRYVELLIDGFSHDLLQDSELNLERFIQIWPTWLNPLKIITNDHANVKASQITNVNQLINYLAPNWNRFQNIEIKIDQIGEANDEFGFLEIGASFWYNNKPLTTPKQAKVKLYGFQTNHNQENH